MNETIDTGGKNASNHSTVFNTSESRSDVDHKIQVLDWIFSQIFALWFLIPSLLVAFIIGFLLSKVYFKIRSKKRLRAIFAEDSSVRACENSVSVGFFHPYCNAGGGGERVLWCAVRALQSRYNFVQIVVYTGDVDCKPADILERAKQRFGIHIKRHVHFVYLHRRPWVTAERYPFLTLLGQSLGSMILGFEALFKLTPDVYIDSMGYAFTLPIFKYIGGCKTCSYVHYPTISTDMLSKVNERQADFNNAQYIARNPVLSNIKVFYYKIFAFIYGMCGRCSDVVMVNSTWTNNHIKALWKPNNLSTVYPPCNTKGLQELYMDEDENGKPFPYQIISLAQFRPEKNHTLQLEAFATFIKMLPSQQRNNYRLLMVGSCRNESDEAIVDALKVQAKELKIKHAVNFHLNVPYQDLLKHLAQSIVGLHTMKDEHFGIGVVEFMAGGLIPLAHNSAGPKMDIVVQWNDMETGFLADSCDSYVNALQEIFLKMKKRERYAMCKNARECVSQRFSEETFTRKFIAVTETLLN